MSMASHAADELQAGIPYSPSRCYLLLRFLFFFSFHNFPSSSPHLLLKRRM